MFRTPLLKVSLVTFIKSALCVFLGLLSPVFAVANQAGDSQGARQAEALWEQAIAAKGGREQLYRVKSLVISYQETSRNFLGVPVHRGLVELLYVFPDKSWGWDDGLPPPFHLSIRLLNLERDLRCYLYAGAAAAVCGPVKQAGSPPDEGLTQVQYLYLMETKWVKPIPLNVTSARIGLKKFDVVHCRFENKRIDYFLDRKTHLPARVALFHGAGERPYTIDFSDYVTVSGIQMPGKQKKGKINFLINSSYDETIFNRPISIAAGPHAWQLSIKAAP